MGGSLLKESGVFDGVSIGVGDKFVSFPPNRQESKFQQLSAYQERVAPGPCDFPGRGQCRSEIPLSYTRRRPCIPCPDTCNKPLNQCLKRGVTVTGKRPIPGFGWIVLFSGMVGEVGVE